MKVTFPTDVSTELLASIRKKIDGGSLVVVDEKGRALFKIALASPCAPEPKDGTLTLHDPKASVVPDLPGVASRALLVSKAGSTVIELDVGEEGSGAAVEVSKVNVKAEDIVRCRSRLVLKW